MLEQLNEMESTGLAELAAACDAEAVEKWRIACLGTKGRLKAVMPLMKDVAIIRDSGAVEEGAFPRVVMQHGARWS